MKRIPLIGGLVLCSKDDITSAVKEVASITLFATMPLWLPLIGNFLFTYHFGVKEAVESGELFIYTAAISGPLAFTITKQYGRKELNDKKLTFVFPSGGSFVVIIIILCMLSSLSLAILRFQNIVSISSNGIINHGGIYMLSVSFFLTSTFILFFVTAYRNMLDSTVLDLQPDQENEFYSRWKGRTQ
ncbi:MAG: hypothetical protein HZA67_12810 [Rhodospirillales bacterium]|nr:hypothetical protein [Rhodospirillales bacterium]